MNTRFLFAVPLALALALPAFAQSPPSLAGPTLDHESGLRIVARDPLMRGMALVMFFGVAVGTLLYNEQAAVARQIADDEARTAFFATIDLWINGLTLAIQLFITPFLLARFGVAPLLLIPGLAITLGFAVLAGNPLPMLLMVVQIATRTGEFALAKPARETIYTRVDAETRYKAKAVIDTAIYRGGDLFFVWAHKFLAAFGSAVVFGAGMLVAGIMTLGAWRLIREQARLPPEPR